MKSLSYIILLLSILLSPRLTGQQIMVEHVSLAVTTDTVIGSPKHRIGAMLRYRSTAAHPNPGYITLFHYKKDSAGFNFVQKVSLSTIWETDVYCFHRDDYYTMTCGTDVQLDSGYHRFVFSSEHINWISSSTVLPYNGVAWVEFETEPRIGSPNLYHAQCHRNEINSVDTLRYDTISSYLSFPPQYRGPFHHFIRNDFSASGSGSSDPLDKIDSMTVSVSNNVYSFNATNGTIEVDTSQTNAFTHQTYTYNGLYNFQYIPSGPGIYPNTFTFSGYLGGSKIWTSTSQFSFHVGDYFGLNEPSEKKTFKVYPNPALNVVTIENPFPQEKGEVFCLNASGEEVLRTTIMPFEDSIQIEIKQSGLYILVYTSESDQLSQRVVIE